MQRAQEQLDGGASMDEVIAHLQELGCDDPLIDEVRRTLTPKGRPQVPGWLVVAGVLLFVGAFIAIQVWAAIGPVPVWVIGVHACLCIGAALAGIPWMLRALRPRSGSARAAELAGPMFVFVKLWPVFSFVGGLYELALLWEASQMR